jgi:Type II secretion system (T2SS), protein G
MLSLIRQAGPLASLCRIGVLLCGVAFTWTCAALGMLRVVAQTGNDRVAAKTDGDRIQPAADPATATRGGDRVRLAEDRVEAIVEEVNSYQMDHHHCPATKDALIAGGYLSASFLVDPWGRSITYSCTDDDTVATSAGPDGLFGTDDDVRSLGPE